MKWPKEVIVVEAEDMCVGKFSDGKGRHCASGWADVIFGPNISGNPKQMAAVHTAFSGAAHYVVPGSSVIGANDRARSDADRARIVNLATALLGYTEGNPEAATARKLKVRKLCRS